tara:strand:+ start:164 stop:400 length:237 start_codon:yes stop_codon:yes gene_type:complete
MPKKSDDFIQKVLSEFQRIVQLSAPAANAAYTLIGSILFFSLLGYFFDSMMKSEPILMVFGTVLGLVVGLFQLYKFMN